MDNISEEPRQLVVKNEDVEAVGALIRKLGGYVEFKESDASADNQYTPLHKVVSKYDEKKILKLLVSTDVNFKDSKGFTTLQYVLDRRDLEEAKRLIDAGADVNTKSTSNDYAALHVAAENANIEMIEYLLSKGADINLKRKRSERTPLQEAVISNRGNSHFETIKVLLKNEADANNVLASEVHNLKMVKLFLDYKVKPTEDVLLRAIELGSVEVVKLLLINGFDAKSLDPYNKSALFRAVDGGNVEIVQLLVDYDFDVNSHPHDEEDKTLLHKVASCNKGQSHYKVAELLLKMGLDINSRKSSHWLLETPLHNLLSRKESDFKVLELFLNYNPDLTIPDWHGETALVKAIECRNVEFVKLLLDRGSDVNAVNPRNGQTPLHMASFLDNLKIIKFLMNNGANPQALDHKGNSPLTFVLSRYSSCETIREGIVKFLLKYSDVNIINEEEGKILEFDKDRRHKNCRCKINIVKHLAKLQALDLPLHPIIFKSFEKYKNLSDYFDKCVQELALAKKTKLRSSWITFFNLLVDGKRKLKNYAGNQDLLEDFKVTNWLKMFPIYGAEMQDNTEKGIERRKLFNDSSLILSNLLCIFNPTHLVIKDVLDLVSTKELKTFCK